MVDITVIILTKNEEKNIKKCISSLGAITDQLIVVDSGSDDNTVKLAKELGANVYFHEFKNHSDQFNWALKNINISTEWVMKIDADEELTPELVEELKCKIANIPNNVNGIVLKRRVYFMGRWLKHGGKYPERLLRIFRNGYGYSENKEMDEHLTITSGDIITFEHDFIDNNNNNLEDWIKKHNWYSNKELIEYKKNRKLKTKEEKLPFQARFKRIIKNNCYYKLPKFFRAHLYFIYRYYIRFGFLDGTEGKIYTFLQAYWYRYLVDSKIYEYEKFGGDK